MKLSELKIETYSDQLNEKELTEVKGGTWHICVGVVVAAALLVSSCGNGTAVSTQCTTVETISADSTCTTTTTVCSGAASSSAN